MENRTVLSPIYVGALFLAAGALMIVASLDSERNALTRVLFRLWTSMPRVGSMADTTWVLLNGFALVLVGVTLLVVSSLWT
jgi:hypothetical protein